MPETDVVGHYGRAGLAAELRAALLGAGFDLDRLDPDALAGVDEFHLGGRVATTALLDSLDLDAGSQVLEVGCGIGGAARAIARKAGCKVTGVDLTPEFVEAATELSELVGLAELTMFQVGSALNLPFDDASFDALTMLHVGMNIADKAALMAELGRVLRPGATLAIYDIMRIAEGALVYPQPWAVDQTTSFVAAPDDYMHALTAAGLAVTASTDRSDLVLRVIEKVQQNPPAVNLNHLMGPGWPTMFGNTVTAVQAGLLSPIEIIVNRPTS